MAARKRPILKKRTAQEQKEDLESLFVFGYQCKLFKDDEKADYIERGKHLIPWMGDNSLMIDRYDGRGYLHDLRPYDADLNCHKNTELTGEELAVEAACEEERYLELNTDYMERVLYEEEELKRLHEALGEDSYGAVGFSYDQGVGQQNDQENSDSEKDEEFIPPSDFHVPDGIKLPDTVKMNAIVVRTAKCISEHGTQMEIIIKTKQADNPQFHFLEYDSELYPYYRHLVQVIKSGRYNPSSMLKPRRSRQESVTEEDEHYLHPSLVKTSSSSNLSTQDILSIISHRLPVSQISDTPYARLVEKMKQSGCRSPLNSRQPRSQAAPVGDVMPALEPPPKPPFAVIADAEPPKNHGHLPPVPGVEPVILPPRSQPPPQTTHPPQEYAPPHRDTEDDERPQIEPPPPDLQSIIDKMAMYVAKNGPEFEIVVKSKKDKRFDFLHSWHKHFPYYHHKKTLHLQELKGTGSSSSGDDDDSNSNDRGQLKSISFSIRNKETDSSVSLSGRAALLGYDSSSEDDSSGEKDEDGDIDNASEGTVVIPENVTTTKERTPPTTEEQEKRLVEQKLRDKLASAARDKLAHAAKEKQLQAERKRKAAMFISMLKGGAPAAQPNTEVQPPGSSLPTSASAPTMSLDGNSSSTRNDAPLTGTPPNYRRSPDLYSRFPRRSRSPINHHRSRHKRHWSPTKRRSRSPVKRARGKTPPTAYSVVRRSLSKSPRRRQKSRSRSPHRPRRPRPPTPSLDKLSLSVSKSKSKGKKRSRSRSQSKRRSRSKSKSISRRRSRSKGRSVSKAKESTLSRVSPSRMKSQKHRSRSRSRSKLKRTRKSPPRSKKHKRLGSGSPSKRRKSHSRSPSRHKSKKHSHSKSKKKSPKHKSKSRTKKSSSKTKRSSRSRSRSKKPSSSPSPVLSPTSKQPSRSRSHSVDDALDSKVESKRSPSVSKSPSVNHELRTEDRNQNVKKAEGESESGVKSPVGSDSTNDNSPTHKEHKAVSSREATDDDASNDSDVIITGEETAPLRDHGATDSPLGVEKPVSEDLLMKVRAMLKASRQEIDTT